MHHAMLDRFAEADTPAHRLDPAAKTVAAMAVILAAALVGRTHPLSLAPLAGGLALYQTVARVPAGFAAKRIAVVSPFALAAAVFLPFAVSGPVLVTVPLGGWSLEITRPGVVRAGCVLAVFAVSAWSCLLLAATTPLQELALGLERLRVPRVFVLQLSMLYRYLWVLSDEAMRLRRARAARDAGRGGFALAWRSRAALVASLFLRSWDRAERIHRAMVARGFDGTLPAHRRWRLRPADVAFAAGVTLGAAAIVAATWGRHG